MTAALIHGHDVTWTPAGAVVDLAHLPDGQPVALVESDDPSLYERALALGARYIACGDRAELVASYLDGVDPGRASVRRDLLAACDASRGGTHAQRDAALDALLASVRD